MFFVVYITLPGFVAARFSLNEAQTGLFMAFISLMAVCFAGSLPVLTRVLRARYLVSVAFLLFGTGHLLFAHATSLRGMVAGAIAMGAGFGFSIPVANHLVIDESPAPSRGRNLSYLSMAIFLGQFASSFGALAFHDASIIMVTTGSASVCIGVAWLSFSTLPHLLKRRRI